MAQHRKYGKKGNKLSNLPCMNVLMLNPKVGLILVISSPLSFLRIVVFPALSRPLWRFGNLVMYESWWAYRKSKRISFSFCRFLRIIVSKPIAVQLRKQIVVVACKFERAHWSLRLVTQIWLHCTYFFYISIEKGDDDFSLVGARLYCIAAETIGHNFSAQKVNGKMRQKPDADPKDFVSS